MKSIVLRKEIEPLPIDTAVQHNDGYEGILNSTFKSVAIQNFENIDSKSIFGIRQRLKTYQFRAVSETATLLKLAVFILALSIAIF